MLSIIIRQTYHNIMDSNSILSRRICCDHWIGVTQFGLALFFRGVGRLRSWGRRIRWFDYATKYEQFDFYRWAFGVRDVVLFWMETALLVAHGMCHVGLSGLLVLGLMLYIYFTCLILAAFCLNFEHIDSPSPYYSSHFSNSIQFLELELIYYRT